MCVCQVGFAEVVQGNGAAAVWCQIYQQVVALLFQAEVGAGPDVFKCAENGAVLAVAEVQDGIVASELNLLTGLAVFVHNYCTSLFTG